MALRQNHPICSRSEIKANRNWFFIFCYSRCDFEFINQTPHRTPTAQGQLCCISTKRNAYQRTPAGKTGRQKSRVGATYMQSHLTSATSRRQRRHRDDESGFNMFSGTAVRIFGMDKHHGGHRGKVTRSSWSDSGNSGFAGEI